MKKYYLRIKMKDDETYYIQQGLHPVDKLVYNSDGKFSYRFYTKLSEAQQQARSIVNYGVPICKGDIIIKAADPIQVESVEILTLKELAITTEEKPETTDVVMGCVVVLLAGGLLTWLAYLLGSWLVS